MWLTQICPLTETDYSFDSSLSAVKFMSSGVLYTSYYTTSNQKQLNQPLKQIQSKNL